MRISDLGSLAIQHDGPSVSPGGRKPSAILSLLLINANRRVSTDALAEAVWGEPHSDRISATLESHIWRLRRILEPQRAPREASMLVNDAGGYRLLVAVDQVDSLRFERLGDDVRSLLAAGDAGRALRRADEALALWRGRPYGAAADDDWALAAVARLEEAHAQLQERRIDALLQMRLIEPALGELEALTRALPQRERLWALQMLALHQAGRADDALRAFQSARSALAEHAGADPGPELQELQGRILAQDPALSGAAGEPVRPAAPPAVHLPRRGTALVGRSRETAAVERMVAESALVTIVGAAGCGKTRLALEIAAAVAPQFVDGVWFIDLAAVDSDDLVLDVVNSTIGLAPTAVGAPLDSLRDYARDRRMLLILDNCEHVLDAVSAIAAAILDADSACHLLATSREALMVSGESVWALVPLAVDAEGDTGSVSPALELFLARVRAADPGLVLAAADLDVARGICRGVDGLPLALELAAARVRSSTLAEIAHQVSTDPASLARIGRGPASHRQTIGAAIEWSYRLLGEDEQLLHRRLSVLPGQFTRECAAAVAAVDGGPSLGPAALAEALASLVHRSLLGATRSSRPDGPILFSQLVTVRSHAAGALHDAGESGAALDARNAWVRTLLASRPRCGHPDDGFYDAVDESFAIVRATLKDLLIDRPGPGAWFLMPRISHYWYYRNRLIEAERWLELATAAPLSSEPSVDQALTLLSRAGAYGMRGRFDRARPLLDLALPLLDSAPGAALLDVAEFVASIGLVAALHEEFDVAAVLGEHVQAIARRSGSDEVAVLADALHCVAGIRARPLADTLALAEAIHDRGLAAGNLIAAWIAAGVLTSVALLMRDAERGRLWSARSTQLQLDLGARRAAIPFETRANLEAIDGQSRQAARMYAASRAQSRRTGIAWPAGAITAELMQQVRAALGPAAFDEAWAEGEGLSVVAALA